jgi:DNA-binding NtrC family response regulator
VARSTRQKRVSVHPIVAAYCRTGTAYKAFLEVGGPSGPLEEALLALAEAVRGKVDAEEALSAAREVPASGHDAGLYLLFLIGQIAVASRAARVAEMFALLARAKSMVRRDTPVELRARLLNSEATMASRAGNMVESERLSRKALDLVASDSAHYPHLFLTVANFLGNLGRGAEVEYLFAELSEEVHRSHAAGIAVAKLRNATFIGQVADAVCFLKQVPNNPAVEAFHGPVLPHNRALIRLMLRHWHTPLAAAAKAGLAGAAFMDASGNELLDWELVSDCLARRDPQQALARARVMAAENVEAQVNEYGFDAYALVRAELSAGNGEAGRRIIEVRRRRGNCAYIDDFFLARAELLAGHEEEAGRHFAAVRAACERYRAQPRLEFELHLSCELSAGQGVYLVRLAGECAKPSRAQAPTPTPDRAEQSDGGAAAQLLGASAAMAKVREQIASFAPLDAPVLITGETGTGKEVAALALHQAGPGNAQPYLAINCGAISEDLLESELFGHRKGAFTGASRARKGVFEEAGEGTVLLDEIGEMPPRLQVAMLRVLECGEIRPVGASRTKTIHCRILAATNADLDLMARESRFREDLLFRLKRLELRLPSLRESPGDVVLLAEHFLALDRRDGEKPVMSESLKAELRSRNWKGNVRELRNAIERMRLLNSDKVAYDMIEWRTAEPSALKPSNSDDPAGSARGAPARNAVPQREAPALQGGRSKMRQLETLRELFRRHRQLTRREVARTLEVSSVTAGVYIAALCSEGLVEKVEPNRSPRSHYFQIRDEA